MSKELARRQPQAEVVVSTSAPAAMSPVYLGSIAVPAHEVLDLGRKIAKSLADIIIQQQLFVNVQNKKHVYVEGWTTMGAMLGITPREVSSVEIEPGVYEGTVELVRLSDGMVIGRASAVCGSEELWKKREKHARKSMATTRATGKAFRLAFSWIMKLAGYEPTPAEEMPHGWGDSGSKEQQAEVRDQKLAELRKFGPCEHCGGPTDNEGECAKCRDFGGTDIREDPLPQPTQGEIVQPSPVSASQGPPPAADPKAGKYLYPTQAADLVLFGKAKRVVGEEAYRRCLRCHKVERSLQFTSHSAAEACLADLRNTAEAQKADRKLKTQKVQAEMDASSLYCTLPESKCPIHLSNQIATHIKALKIPLEQANETLRNSFTDYQVSDPMQTPEQIWALISMGLENLVKGRAGK